MQLLKFIGRRLASQRSFSSSLTVNIKPSASSSTNSNFTSKANYSKKPVINIKDSCLQRLRQILDKPNDQFLRVHVEAGGCSGFQYLFEIEPSEKLDPSNDLIIERDQYRIVIEKQVLPFIEGSDIEYNESLIKSSFKISNPIADSKCSCGSSFSIDFNKKSK